MLNTVQSGANATLNKALGAPIVADLCVTLANTVVYLLAGASIGLKIPTVGF